MANRVKIPGRLESAETGNIVTGADAVMDDAKGKTQVVINSEVDAAIISLAQGKQDALTFDSAPTEDSPNPVTSAGVYTADKVLSDAIEAILLLIPSAASALNKLVDMQTMNSSIATATASFKGTYNLVSDLHLGVDATHEQIGAALDVLSLGADNNDYAFVQVPNSATAPTEIRVTERYKFNGTNWLFEYDLNNSGFTQGQWNAINSGVTSLLVGKLSNLPTNAELTALLAGKQDNLTFDNVPTAGSPNPVKSGGVYARNNEIVALINALDVAKQDVLTFDNAPVEGSPNPVKSGGVYTAISAVQAAIVALDAEKQNVLTFDSTPMLGSSNPVMSSGIKTELNRIDGNITTLNDLYQALTQSSLVVVAPTDTWPVSNPDNITIYRVVDRVNTPPQYYSDYMFSGSTPVLMAQYDNAIDDEPVYGSQNLVKSGGVLSFSQKIVSGASAQKRNTRGSAGNIELDFYGVYFKGQEFQVTINQSDSANTAVQVFVSDDGGSSWLVGYSVIEGMMNDNGFKIRLLGDANVVRVRKQNGATVFDSTITYTGLTNLIDSLGTSISNESQTRQAVDESMQNGINKLDAFVAGGAYQKRNARGSAGDLYLDYEGFFFKGQEFTVTINESDSETTTVQLFTSKDGVTWGADFRVTQGLLNDSGFAFKLTCNVSFIRIRKQSGATVFDVTLTYVGCDETVGKIDDALTLPKEVRLLVIGDSYSYNGGNWIPQMMSHFAEGSSWISLAVGSASVKDKYTDRTMYPYTSRPVSNVLDGNLNTFACQIEKLDRLMAGVDLDPDEEQIYATQESYPNVIIIQGGMNDLPDNDQVQETYMSQFQKKMENVYVKSKMTGEVTLGTFYILTPAEEVNRTCFGGAYRYLVESLQTRFPDAQIFITTASMLGYWTGNVVGNRTKTAEQQRICANYASVGLIDWNREGQISIINNHGVGEGTQEHPYLSQVPSGLDTDDTMHPNSRGGNKYARIALAKIVSTFMEIKDY